MYQAEVEAQQEEEADESQEGDHRDQGGGRERGAAEQRQVQHRAVAAPLRNDKGRGTGHCHEQRHQDLRVGEGSGTALDHSVHQRGDRHRRGDLARPVEPPFVRGTRVGQQPRGEDHRDQRDGNDQEVDPPPGRVLQHDTGYQRSDGQRHQERCRPQADELAAFPVVGHGMADQGQGRGQQRGRTHPGECLAGPQQRYRRRCQRDCGTDGGEQQARLEHLLAPVDVPDHTGRQDERRHGQDERVLDPGQLGRRRAQRRLDGGQAHGDGGHRQVGDEDAQTGHDERGRPTVGPTARQGCDVQGSTPLRRGAPR